MPATMYDVSITGLSELSAESQGFIDPTKVEQYMVSGDAPDTVAASKAKERANIRYEMMIGALGMMANLYVSNVVATGATADSPATTLAFRLTSEHGEECLVTPDEANTGQFLVGEPAIKRVIARTLLASRTDFGDFYDPTMKAAFIADGSTVNAVRVGTRIESVQVTAAAVDLAEAESVISVVQV